MVSIFSSLFFFTLCLPQKIIEGNSFFCQGQASPVKTLLFPLQNVCNNSVHRLVIHGAFPVFICNYSSHSSPALAFLIGYILHTMIPNPVPEPLSSPPLSPKQRDKELPMDVASRAAKSHLWWLFRSCCVTLTFLGNSSRSRLFLVYGISLSQKVTHIIPRQMLRRYEWLPTDLCQLKIKLDHFSWSCTVLLLNPGILAKQISNYCDR